MIAKHWALSTDSKPADALYFLHQRRHFHLSFDLNHFSRYSLQVRLLCHPFQVIHLSKSFSFEEEHHSIPYSDQLLRRQGLVPYCSYVL